MKKLIIATAVICSLGLGSALAAGDVNQKVQELKTEFNLNDQQAQQIQQVMSGEITDEQKAERHNKRMDRKMARMQEKLGLTDEQVTKIKALREGQHEKRTANREAHRAQIEAILTSEQKEKFSAMKGKQGHEMDNHRREMGRHGGNSGQCNHHSKHGGDQAQQQ